MYWLVLGAILTFLVIQNNDMDGWIVAIIIGNVLQGLYSIWMSVSKKHAKESKLEARDERNQLIELKTLSQAFRWMQNCLTFLILIFLIIAFNYNEAWFRGLFGGLIIALILSNMIEVICDTYQKRHN